MSISTQENWNFAKLAEASLQAVPKNAPALIHGEHVTDWESFHKHTNALARIFMDTGVEAGGKVAHFMRNQPAYMECFIASAKARLVHVNVNYRYQGDELLYILENSDSEIVVYDRDFAPILTDLQPQLPKVKLWLEIGDDSPVNAFAHDYESLISNTDSAPVHTNPTGDDLLFIYTGGTTGLPKGVMWRHEDLWQALGGGVIRRGQKRPVSLKQHVANLKDNGTYGRILAAAPFMHSAGLMTALNAISNGGCVITLPGGRFDAEIVLQTIEKAEATVLMLVGDAFGRPLARALDASLGSIDKLRLIISSGSMLAQETKDALLRHNPKLTLLDTYGSSEGIGIGTSTTTAENRLSTARFQLGKYTRLFTEDFQEIPVGSHERGLIGRGGAIPSGYYKDPEKTAQTFPTINGVRYSIPGDWGIADKDGNLTLLGRGNQCINTGGEKVFPEEVEEALKTHEGVEDAIVFGVDDERWGQKVMAVVALNGTQDIPSDILTQHVKEQLADYKAPKAIYVVDHVPRHPNGKADYEAARALAAAQDK